MIRKEKTNSGITLIALIITIIVLLILAGISIATLFGENGILNNAQKSKEQTLIKEYEENIRLAVTEGNSNAALEPDKYQTKEDILDNIGDIIRENPKFENAQIQKLESGTEEVKLVVTTKEGYVYEVYVDKVEYKGKIGKDLEEGDQKLDITLTDEDIKYTYTPSGWTNGEVKVGIEIKKEEYKDQGYEIEYSYNLKNWEKYTEEIIVNKNNTKIYTRLKSGIAVTKKYATGNVTNIDIDVPTIGSATVSSTTGNTGTITVSNIVDEGGSGLTGIYISTNSTKPEANAETGWEDNTEVAYTKEVTENGTYNVWVKDGAGNVSNAKTCTVSGIVAKVTEVTLTDATVEEGQTVTIQKTLTGSQSYKTIEFTSSDTGVATIDETTGEATGLKVGTTTITCKITNYDGISVSGTCTLTVKASGLKASQLTAEDIGETVINYKPTADTETEWQIFFTDGEDTPSDKNDDHIYLISKDYIPKEKLPSTSAGNRPNDGRSVYPRAAYFTAVQNDYTNKWATMIKENKLKDTLAKYHKWANIEKNQSNNNEPIRSVAYMLDEAIWTKQYGTDDTEYVIGGPTIEMFCKSYKMTHPDKYIEYDENYSFGYKVKWQSDSVYGEEVLELDTKGSNNLYIINSSYACGYWFASFPHTGAGNAMTIRTDLKKLTLNGYSFDIIGFRPVVCLKSTTQFKKVSGGYEIVE